MTHIPGPDKENTAREEACLKQSQGRTKANQRAPVIDKPESNHDEAPCDCYPAEENAWPDFAGDDCHGGLEYGVEWEEGYDYGGLEGC